MDANDDFDSVASAVYEAIDDSPSQRMDSAQIDSQLQPDEDDEEEDADDEEMSRYSKSSQLGYGEGHQPERTEGVRRHNDIENEPDADDDDDDGDGDGDGDDDEESSLSLHLQVDDDISEECFRQHIDATFKRCDHRRSGPLIVQDKSGLIKKIKISPPKKAGQNYAQSMDIVPAKATDKALKVIPSLSDEKTPQQRSSTPLSREYVALQKTQSESKIIKKFVTDAMLEKTRKGKAKDPNSINTPTTATPSTSITSTDHSYTSRRRSNNNSHITPEKDHESHSISQSKRHCSRRFVPLKDQSGDTGTEAATAAMPRSRSKSMHNSDHSDHSNSSSSHQLLKKWPSDERVATVSGKRTNMRSENSEFVQKQKEFLQHVINSTQDTPRRRSRSHSTGVESTDNVSQTKPHKCKDRASKRIASDFDTDDEKNTCQRRSRSRSTGNTSGVESTTGTSLTQTKCRKSKERISKRTKVDADDDDKPLSQSIVMECSTTTDDHGDDSSVNNSNNSTIAVNTSADVTTTSTDNVDHLVWQPPPKPGSDSFCWKCHETHVNLSCSKCIRSFHATCARAKIDSIWICPECTTVDNILNSTKKSRRNELSVDLLNQLLAFALKRMRYAKGNYSFVMPYEEVNIYKNIIVNPVHFGTLEAKIDSKEYRCAEEFVNETKWMLHNAYVLSSGNNTKTVLGTKGILKICRQEANEIETCAECYLNANTRTDWFVDVCSQPHLLLWAKLKGFPYWPAKAMGFGQNSLVNVRFFGEHDRAFVSVKECFLYSVQDPNTQTGKKAARELADCMKEVEEHIEKIKSKVGGFKYAPYKTPYDPTDEMKQLDEMMPGVQEFIKKQQGITFKPSLQFKIYKTADNNLSIVQKASSTPDLPCAQQLQQDEGDDLHTSAKKKKCFSSCEDEKKLEEKVLVPVSAAKYEVISKVTSDDSNSSKLSTVILKRKSANGDAKKNSEDDHTDLPLPKMQRIEENAGFDGGNHAVKRKVDIGNGDKSKGKHDKQQQQKIPVITIKTLATHKDSKVSSLENEIVKEEAASEASVTTKEMISATKSVPLTKTQQHESSTSAQKAVENLVRNKQGVTIKKISKDPPPPPPPIPLAPPTATVPPPPPTSVHAVVTLTLPPTITTITTTALSLPKSSDVCKAKETQNSSPNSGENSLERLTKGGKLDKEKHLQEQQVTSMLKGLVPFVEIKEEILSENEEEPANSATTTDMLGNKSTPEPPSSATQAAKEPTSTNNNSSGKDPDTTPALLTRVKEEVFSDEEEIKDNSAQIKEQAPIKLSSLQTTERSCISKNTNDVRVVGDTTIQKLSSKNANQPNSSNTNKRTSLKGIPYGPLPASAFPKVCIETMQNDAIGLLPRAKKSFPQLAQTIDKLRCCPANGNVNVPGLITTGVGHVNSSNQHLDHNKRTMSKTTMVAIPVDVAATTRTSSSLGTMMGSIPVPPLTAVSKTAPSSNAYNSLARNTPVTVTVSGTSGSLTTPSVMAIKSTTAVTSMMPSSASSASASATASSSSSNSTSPVMARNSPITVVTMTSTSPTFYTSTSSLTTTTTATATATATATSAQNHVNPLTMSAPPPLAGLSGSNLNNALPNGIMTSSETTTSTTTIPTTATQLQAGPDTHILGGLITPSLTSAITDIICRGPPKLAARPSGPLQSEGHPMFPSQAGPVCKRLVDNAHKLSDFFISVMEDTMGEVAQGEDASLQAKLTLVTMELERTKLAHEQQNAELKRNSDLMLCEMRKSMENEKSRLVNETRKQCELEWKQRELDWKRRVDETKHKQWCAQCGREANFYCCWNTSYCDYPCQQLHWGRHAANCAQNRQNTQDATTATTITGNLQNSSGIQERHHGTKSSAQSSTSLITPANVNTKSSSISHSKKEKVLTKNASSNHLMTSSMPTAPGAASAASSRSNNTAEVLKLPTNTYLRPVTSSLSNQTLRCNTTYSIPVQRFNVPLPITTPANTPNGPQTFTILHQGNSWVMSSGAANTGTSSTIAAPVVSVPQITQQRSSGSMMTANKSTKTQIRYH